MLSKTSVRIQGILMPALLAGALLGLAACSSTAPEDISGSAIGTSPDVETPVDQGSDAAPQDAPAAEAPDIPEGLRAVSDPKGQARAAAQAAEGSTDSAASTDSADSANANGLTNIEVQTLLAAHNRWRANFGSDALSWDPAVAAVAQAWAEQLAATDSFEHSHNPLYGENLWAGSTPASFWTKDGIVDDWGNEVANWDLSCTGGLAQCCRPGTVCGHFTQVVWWETTKLGCGQASSAGTVYVVCNYAPPGNFPRSPFKGGQAPTAVPTAGGVEPTVAVPTPTTAPAQPTMAPIVPTTAPVQPTTAPSQPTTAPARPTATTSAGGGLSSWSTWADMAVEIPDNSSEPATYDLLVTKAGTISSLGVGVRITHTYVGDLTVVLVHPDGSSVILRNQRGGDADNIDETYGKGGIPVSGLSALNGKPLAGTWQIQVYDSAEEDTGTLDRFSLNFVYAKP